MLIDVVVGQAMEWIDSTLVNESQQHCSDIGWLRHRVGSTLPHPDRLKTVEPRTLVHRKMRPLLNLNLDDRLDRYIKGGALINGRQKLLAESGHVSICLRVNSRGGCKYSSTFQSNNAQAGSKDSSS